MEINEEDWELINDDGFIYWRPKRQRINPPITPTVHPPDLAAEANTLKQRKKNILLNLQTKYQQEIRHWELLSNTLQALQNRTQNNHNQPPVLDPTVSVVSESLSDFDFNYRALADNLLSQVEAQEATIREISRLCDVAEALCEAKEQRLKQPFIDLPIWEASTKELIRSLIEE